MATQMTSENEVIKVLDKIKAEIMQRKQLRAQNETNKQLDRMNKNLSKIEPSKEKATKPIEIKFPTVAEIVGGFARMSPIFTRDYSTWMKDTVNIGVDGNQELERIASGIESLKKMPSDNRDNTSEEYLDLISDQLKAANDDSIKRLDNQGDTLGRMSTDLTRIGDSLSDIQRESLRDMVKGERDNLVRLVSIEDKIGRVGGQIVSTLKRIYESDRKDNEKDQMRRGEESKEVGNNPRATSIIPQDDSTQGQDSSSSGIGAAIATMLGLSALKTLLGKPLGIFGKFFKMFGKMEFGVSKLLGPLGKVTRFIKAGPLALLSSAIDFGKGFINAKEILGKTDVTVVDRIRAGAVEIVGGFGDLADWIAGIFGYDTTFGKDFRDVWLKITETPAKWAQSIVDWFANDLFAGIGRGTALTDIPGKIADNLQSELAKLVDWISGGISSFIDEGIAIANKVIDDIKKGFAEKVKKPFFNMLNAITNAMFDIVDKFVDLIPDSLGGEAARKKMADARQAMMITDDNGTATNNTQAPDTANQIPPQPKIDMGALQPMPSGVSSDYSKVGDNTAQLKDAYASLGGGTLGGTVTPTQGKAASNIQEVKSVYSQAPASVVMPVQQNVNAPKQINNTTNLNSTSLEPSNQKDNSRILWDW